MLSLIVPVRVVVAARARVAKPTSKPGINKVLRTCFMVLLLSMEED